MLFILIDLWCIRLTELTGRNWASKGSMVIADLIDRLSVMIILHFRVLLSFTNFTVEMSSMKL